MYCFDRGLRKLVTAELEKIEVAIRAKMIYILSHQYGPFWYSAPNLFESLQLHLRGHLIESTPFLYTHKELCVKMLKHLHIELENFNKMFSLRLSIISRRGH